MRTLIVAALFVSSSAMAACPVLSGNYKICTSSEGSTTSDVLVAQVIKNGYVNYSITSTDDESHERSTMTYIADGKTRTTTDTDPDSGMSFVTKTTATCNGSSLAVNVQVSTEGETFANLTMTSTKIGQRLSSATTGKIFGEAHNSTEVCE